MFESEVGKQETAQKESWIKKNWSSVLVGLAFIAGLILFLYPSFANYWNSFNQSRAIMTYSEVISNMSEEEYDKQIAEALEYNSNLAKTGANWKMTAADKDDYNSKLNFAGDGNMGYIRIEKIKVTLPIYHGTNEKVLQTSIGHLEGSSLPVGASSYNCEEGKVMDPEDGSHCVLTGHRGLPSSKLFSDLDKLAEGDVFSLNVLGETYTYQIDQIRVVEPSDLSELKITPGMDYCTLVTCTPYGINTHRLLVRGHRTANPQGDVTIIADAILIDRKYVAPFIAGPILLILILGVLISDKKKKRNKSKAVGGSDS